jgi:hypothetical protein
MSAGVEVAKRGFAPEPLRDFVVRYQFLPMLEQQQEELHWLSRESNAVPVATQLVGRRIELEISETVGHAGSGGGLWAGSMTYRAISGRQSSTSSMRKIRDSDKTISMAGCGPKRQRADRDEAASTTDATSTIPKEDHQCMPR